MAKIHNMAIVSPEAQIAEDVEIGPFCTIGPNVTIGAGTKLISNCNIAGSTEIGKNNTIYPFVSMGTPPQDYKYKDFTTYLKIGNGNTFREGFTANTGSKEEASTIIGDYCYFMANSHVAHDCIIGNRVTVCNCSGFTGHTEVGEGCVIAPFSGLHQFARLGKYVIMSACTVYSKDIPPYAVADGRNGPIRTFNKIGLMRNGFTQEQINNIKVLYRIFFRSGLTVPNALKKVKEELEMTVEVKDFVDFVESSKRGITHNTENKRS